MRTNARISYNIDFHKGQKIRRTLENFFFDRKFHHMMSYLKWSTTGLKKKNEKGFYVDLKMASKYCCWVKLKKSWDLLYPFCYSFFGSIYSLVFYRNAALKNFAKFLGKTPVWNALLEIVCKFSFYNYTSLRELISHMLINLLTSPE